MGARASGGLGRSCIVFKVPGFLLVPLEKHVYPLWTMYPKEHLPLQSGWSRTAQFVDETSEVLCNYSCEVLWVLVQRGVRVAFVLVVAMPVLEKVQLEELAGSSVGGKEVDYNYGGGDPFGWDTHLASAMDLG